MFGLRGKMLTKKNRRNILKSDILLCDWVENKDEMTGWNFVKQTFIKAWEVTIDRWIYHPLN